MNDYEEAILKIQERETDDCTNCVYKEACRDPLTLLKLYNGTNPCQHEAFLYLSSYTDTDAIKCIRKENNNA